MLQLAFDFIQRHVVRGPRPVPTTTARETVLEWKHGLAVRLVRRAVARRYLLTLQPDGVARLVIPRGGNEREALRFLARSEAWLVARVQAWSARCQQRQPWGEGTTFLFRGEPVALRLEKAGDGVSLIFADQVVPLPRAEPDYRASVCAHLRRLATRELTARTLELAALHGVAIERVTVRAQRSRWGSCSRRGTISLNWRLVQTPHFVVDYLILHELMHRREMNHSARYWKQVASVCPVYKTAEAWLKTKAVDLRDGL
jgi:predicted metal-dependent hydrolase